MKMVKKILLGTLALAAVLSLASCGKIEDDEDNIIKKNSSTKYSIDYSNSSGVNKRAYESTSLKHAGGLVKVKFDNKDVATSKMGVIFDLHESNGAKQFYIIGLGGNNTNNNFYVSKFTNVTDIQADNFGTKLSSNPAVENEIKALSAANKISVPVASDNSVTMYVYFKANLNGSYDYAVLNLTEDRASAIKNAFDSTTLDSFTTAEKLSSGTITGAFTAVATENSLPQNQLAVYAMVAPNKSLKGTWEYVKTYKEAEEIEE